MSDFLISVIIPCYNVENYVGRCIDSLIAQTIGFKRLQVILVNDASNDGTLSVLESYEKQYPENITVITYEENVRQGGARNTGLLYAEADYIGYIDSDDWIEPQMYEELYNMIQKGQYDTVKCKSFSDDATDPNSFKMPEKREDQDLRFEEINGYCWGEPENKGVNGIFGGVYTGLYRRSLLTDNNIEFPEHTAYEDNFWWGILRLYVRSMYIIDVPYYHYFYNTSSTVRTKNALHHMDRIRIEEKLLEEYAKRDVLDIYYDKILPDIMERYYLNTFFTLFYRFDETPDVSLYNRISSTLYRTFPDWKERYSPVSLSQDEQLLIWWLGRYPHCSQKAIDALKQEYLKLINELYGL